MCVRMYVCACMVSSEGWPSAPKAPPAHPIPWPDASPLPKIQVQYIEIYNEEVRDLLVHAPGQEIRAPPALGQSFASKLEVREHASGEVGAAAAAVAACSFCVCVQRRHGSLVTYPYQKKNGAALCVQFGGHAGRRSEGRVCSVGRGAPGGLPGCAGGGVAAALWPLNQSTLLREQAGRLRRGEGPPPYVQAVACDACS